MKKIAFLLILFLSFNAEAIVDYFPKLSLRTSMGSLNNSGSAGGTTTTFGGFNIEFSYFMMEKLSAGIGYRVHSDLSSGSIPVQGFDITGRYYYYGPGSIKRVDNDYIYSQTHGLFSAYAGMQYAIRSYFLGEDPLGANVSDQLEGNYSAVNLSAGVDYRLSRKWEVTGEVLYTMFAFAASDDRVKIKNTLINFGVTYVFD